MGHFQAGRGDCQGATTPRQPKFLSPQMTLLRPALPARAIFRAQNKNLRPGVKVGSILRTQSLYVGTIICQSRRIMARFFMARFSPSLSTLSLHIPLHPAVSTPRKKNELFWGRPSQMAVCSGGSSNGK